MKKLLTICLAVLLALSIFTACTPSDGGKELTDAEFADVITATKDYFSNPLNSFKCEITESYKEGDDIGNGTQTFSYDNNKAHMYETYTETYNNETDTYVDEYYEHKKTENTYDIYSKENGKWTVEEYDDSEYELPNFDYFLDSLISLKPLTSYKSSKYTVKSENELQFFIWWLFDEDDFDDESNIERALEQIDEYNYELVDCYIKVADGKISEFCEKTKHAIEGEEGYDYFTVKFTYKGVSVTLPTIEEIDDETELNAAEFAEVIIATKDYLFDLSNSYKCENETIYKHNEQILTEYFVFINDNGKQYECFIDDDGTYEAYGHQKSEAFYDFYIKDNNGVWTIDEVNDELDTMNFGPFLDSLNILMPLTSFKNGKYTVKPENELAFLVWYFMGDEETTEEQALEQIEEYNYELIDCYIKVADGKISEFSQKVSVNDGEVVEEEYLVVKFTYKGVSVTLPTIDGETDNETELDAVEFAAAVQSSKDYINGGNYYEFSYTTHLSMSGYDIKYCQNVKVYGSFYFYEELTIMDDEIIVNGTAYIEFDGDIIYAYTQDSETNEWTKTDITEERELIVLDLDSNNNISFLNFIESCYPYTEFINGKYAAKSEKLADIKTQYVSLALETDGEEAAAGASEHDITSFYATAIDGKIGGFVLTINQGETRVNLACEYIYTNDTLTLPTISD